MRRVVWLAALAALSCAKKEASAPPAAESAPSTMAPPEPPAEEAGGSGTQMAGEEGKMGKRDQERMAAKPVAAEAAADDAKPASAPANEEPAAPTRAWFPETFLFEPLIVTDEGGAATVEVKVPDRLTSWRVLALAHTRNGAQAGATHSFLGTLPAYVELVVPAFLVTGDEVRLPVQVVNTTDKAITEPLRLEVQGGHIAGNAPRTVTVPAGGSFVQTVTLVAGKPGKLSLRASLGGTDAVLRTIDVVPYGKPATVTRAGSLAAPRTISMQTAAEADPASTRVTLRVYPGALALLRSELAATPGRSGLAEDAYTLLIAGRARQLLAALGDKPDEEVLRKLSILGTQRAVRHARTLDVPRAALLAEAALSHPDNPVLARMGERAAAWLAQHQRPDGTFSGETGWTLQRLLVVTAESTRAVQTATATPDAQRRAARVALQASGAFERNGGRIDDPYTAAAILASGGAPESLRGKLRKLVLDGIEKHEGRASLAFPTHIVRPDGERPSSIEGTALAVLALMPEQQTPDEATRALLADLGATLLGAYDPWYGWGDGRTNMVALAAVVRLFRDPVPADVSVTLSLGDTEVARGKLSAERLREVLVLGADVPGATGALTWKIAAEPAVPGLAYSLTLEQWVPWSREKPRGGLELALEVPDDLAVGKPATVTLRAVAPGNTPLVITQALPAGVQADTPSLQALVDAGTITAFDTADGTVTLRLPALSPGTVFIAQFKVVATLAGRLRATATTLTTEAPGGEIFHAAPPLWVIR